MNWYVVDKAYINYISSAKPKHQKMSNSLDFHKLQDTSTGYLYAVLNINNMIPVPDNPDSSLAARCCNFKLLEEKCRKFIL